MASGIITNNVRVAIACFAGGVFLGVGSLVLLAYNGLAIGAFAGHFANVGLLGLSPHLHSRPRGAGAVRDLGRGRGGIPPGALGRGPGTLSRGDALVVSGRVAVRMVGATAVLLVVAGLIEGFVSAGGYSVGVRLTASAASLALLGRVPGQRRQISRSIVRIRIARASISLRLVTVRRVELGLVQQQQLGLGEQRRERIGQVVPELAEPVGVRHVS